MKSHLEHIIENVGSLTNKRILDLGAGKGKFLLELTKAGYDATGLEINPTYIAIANENAREAGVIIKLLEGKAEALPFQNNSFDVANVAEVIEHVQDPQKMLSELYRVLSPGGKAYLSVPNRFGMKDQHFHLYFVNWLPRSFSDAYIKMWGKQKDYNDTAAGHQRLSEMHYYTRETILSLVRSAGFTVEDMRQNRINATKPWFKKLGMHIAYPLARGVYFDAFHLLLIKQS